MVRYTLGSMTTTTKQLRALIYARVSHDPKQRGRSISAQIDECQGWADDEGMTVVGIIEDSDVGASRHSRGVRTGWAEACKRLDRGEADVLLTWENSRADRKLGGYVELRELCAQRGVLWGYSGRLYDMNDPDDRARSAQDAIDAEREADRISSRTRRGTKRAAAEGRPGGKLPYGYRRKYDPTTGELLGQDVDVAQAAVVRELADRVLAGESLRSIVDDLNARGVPTQSGDAPWSRVTVRRILMSPTVNGRRVHRGVVVGDAQWPAIIDDATHARLVATLTDPSRRVTRACVDAYLLTGTAVCGACGGSIGAGRSTTGPVYRCRDHGCVIRNREKVDAYVSLVVAEWLAQVSLSDLADEQPPTDVLAARAALVELGERQAQASQLFAKGTIDATVLAQLLADIAVERDTLQGQARHSSLPTIVTDVVDGERSWDDMTDAERRTVVRNVCSVTIHKSANGGGRRFDASSIQVTFKG